MDEKILLLINREWSNPTLDKLMAAASSFDVWLPIFVVAGVAILWRGGFRARSFVLTALALVAINDGIVAKNLKRIVNRPRPHQALDEVRVIDLAPTRVRLTALAQPARIKASRRSFDPVDGRSFPSGHTMNTMTAALVAVAFYGWRMGWTFLAAATVGYSRIYVGAHWPSDVFTTIFLAFGMTLTWLALAEWLWRTQGGRIFPTVHIRHPTLLPA